jgi:hypothetical protein
MSKSRSLVIKEEKDDLPLPHNLLEWAKASIKSETLSDVSEVKDKLPAILGQILALCWLDQNFQTYFLKSRNECMASLGVGIPDEILINSQKTNTHRPSIVVMEKRANSNYKARLFALSLTLMATR